MTSLFQISPTKADLNIDIRDYLLSIYPDLPVVLGRVSREAPPKPPYIRYTDISSKNLATNIVEGKETGLLVESRETLVTYQIDCFGNNAFEMAQTIETLSRGVYPLSVLQVCSLVDRESAIPVTFISGEEEYEQRSLLKLMFQVKQSVTYPVDFIDKIDLKFIGVS